METMYDQQGDVLIYQKSELPKDAKKIDGTTVALGEATGHHHTFYDGNVQLYEAPDKSIWAQIMEPAILKHQEHKPIEFKPGVYRIGIVREFDHAEKVARRVVD